MELSKTAYVILGMLRNGPRTGYEIKQRVESSVRFFWTASYGQIYPELKLLEEAGLVEGESQPTGGRRRRAYALTPSGKEALQEWLTLGEGMHLELRHEGMLRFFFADVLEPAEQVELLRTLRAEHERLRAVLTGISPSAKEHSASSGDRFPLLTLDWGIAYQDFVIDWCTEMERRLTTARSATEGS
jgi:PadR family transcriptional regulator, regulatory protein AphA